MNTASVTLNDHTWGHRAFISELQRRKTPSRVVLEATVIYHLELAFALHKAEATEICVVNPRVFRNFAKALCQRGKTDQKDAYVLAVYAQRMRFEPWNGLGILGSMGVTGP